ncbi:MAG: DUF4115 domain-containing protein [Chloroflexi bacterium]|nr:DUF4115 domain-containing protein [Chloroflexota bacterium]
MQETIGQRLKREREARYLSLEKAAEETRIRRVFLQALEADDYSVMPSAAQGRGFLRNYAEYLSLNIDELIAEIQRNPIPPAEMSGPLPQVNLSETEIPPLTEAADEEPAPRFLDRFLKRKPRVESTPDMPQDLAHSVEVSVSSLEKSQPAAATLPEALEQVEGWQEARPSRWGRVTAWFKVKFENQGAAAVVSENEEQPAQPARTEKPANAIMAEIGAILRERRELISLTIDEVERHTHMRAVFVRALEEGAFEKLPSTVQTRGMLSNYASFLDLDVDAVLLRYADALQARRREKYADVPREMIQTQVKPSIPVLWTFIAGDLIFGVLMIAVIVGLAVWGVERTLRAQGEQAEPTAPSIVEVLGENALPTASPEMTFIAVDSASIGTAEPDQALPVTLEAQVTSSNANVVVSVFALERVFVRISADGEVVFEGRMLPREARVFEGQDQVVILTGDGSALRITYNGADLGLMGGAGEVVNRVYLVTGVATPTATLPPTPTNTPPTTPTFTPSPTATVGQ